MNNTQTAIEWLKEKIKETYDKEGKLPLGYVLNLLSQAKAVEAEQMEDWYGLIKREYFAAMAMQGMLANSAEGNTEWDYNTIAKHSCIAADALVEQLNIK
jgi:hypothetical protein